jgi:hypothetical protein
MAINEVEAAKQLGDDWVLELWYNYELINQ